MLYIYIIFTLYILVKMFISYQEIRYVNKHKDKKAVILSAQNYIKGATYKIESLRLDLISLAQELVLFFVWFLFGFRYLNEFAYSLSEDVNIVSVIFVISFILIGALISLPMSIYQTFVLDKKYGFSNMSVKLFIIDTLKALILTLIFGSGIIWVLSYFINNFDAWWIYGFAFVFVVVIFINAIYPTLIAPIFNKFKILEDEDLKSSIMKLLASAGLKSSGIYTMDASKRDSRLNAYFGGLGKSKRVVLFDTLIKKLTHSELLAVLGHELGHFKHKDILKNIALSAVMMFVMFFIFGNIPNSIFEGIGVEKSSQIILVLFLMLSAPIGFILQPFINWISRRNEYAADEYGAQSQSKEDLANALIKLADENKSFPKSSSLSIIFYHSHPPLLKRLKALGREFDD